MITHFLFMRAIYIVLVILSGVATIRFAARPLRCGDYPLIHRRTQVGKCRLYCTPVLKVTSMCILALLPANPGLKRSLRKVKEKVLSSRASIQREPVQERPDPSVVDNVAAASRSVRVISNDGRPSFGEESTPTAADTIPEALSVNVNRGYSPSPMGFAAAPNHHGRPPLTIGVSAHPGILLPLRGDVATTTQHLYSRYTPREDIVLHVPHPHQRMVVVMTDNGFSSSSDLGSNMHQHGYSQSLSMDSPSRGAGGTGRAFMEDISFAVTPAAYSDAASYHCTTSPAHDLPSRSSTLHSTNGRSCVTPYPPPPCVLPPTLQHDTHFYFDGGESLHSNSSPLIWAAPPQPGRSYTSPAASHQPQRTCGCDTCSPRMRASDVGSGHILPQQLPSRSYSTGSFGSHSTHANPRLARSRSVLVGDVPSRANPSTIITLPFSPPHAPSMTRSDTPPSRRDDSETTAEADSEKLH